MNYFKLIPALWKSKGIIEQEIKEGRMPTASGKPGWKTTEFWMTVATQASVLWGVVHGFVPSPWNVIVPVAASSLYAICATVRKAVSDIQAAKAQTTTTTVTPAPAVVTTTSPT